MGTPRGTFGVFLNLFLNRMLPVMRLALVATAPVLLQARPAEAVSITFETITGATGFPPTPSSSLTLTSPGDTLTFNESTLGDVASGTWDASGTVIVNALPGGITVTVPDLRAQDTGSNPVVAEMLISSDPREIVPCGLFSPGGLCLNAGGGFMRVSGTFTGPIPQGDRISSLTASASLGTFTSIGTVNEFDRLPCPGPPFEPCPGTREPFADVDAVTLFPGEFGLGVFQTPRRVNVLALLSLEPGNGVSASLEGSYGVPEPPSFMLLAIGLIGVGGLRQRGRKRT